MMVVLAAYAIIGLVNLVMSIPFLWNPIFWLFLIFDLLGFCLDVFGFLAVYRLIPEWMVTYGWALLVFLVVDVIRMVTWSVLGALGNAFATLILHAIFTFSMIGCMYSLRAYALACKGIAI
ncbi:hypothetical protein BC830DRAFT_1143886 [Chytriomyces sp. MP71]|nr:hypothetical protein BC830DRAFT_1143886 [Chytriomyces sp. MP71]